MSELTIELATIIAINAAKVQNYLVANKLPTPSFDVDAPKKSMIPPEAKEIEAAREAVIDATTKPRSLMLGPTDFLLSSTPDELISLQAIYRFKLATSFPIHSEASFSQIAQTSSIQEIDACRIIRHAMTKHIFQEPRPGVVAHTALSRLLAEDARLLQWVGANTEEMWPACVRAVDAMVRYPGSEEPNETAFALANHTESSMFQVLGQNRERAQRFGEAMKTYTEGTGWDLRHVVDGYPWHSIGIGKVVDIGGSNGFVSLRLAEAFPLLDFVIQDFQFSIAAGSEQVPPELVERVEFMPHDFLTEQPVKGADVYFFRWVFHNWSDKYCIQMLRNLIPAMKAGSRVLINDRVIPEPGHLSAWPEERIRSMDIVMGVIQNSRERELHDWGNLLKTADDRFKFLGTNQREGSHLSMIAAI